MFRNAAFTLNNYSDAEEQQFKEACETIASYIVFSREVGENNTPHLQGYVQLKKSSRLSALKRFNDRAHWEAAKSGAQENYDYCAHEGKYGYGKPEYKGPVVGLFTCGTMRGQGQRTDLQACIDLMKTTRDLKVVADAHPTVYVRLHRGLQALNAVSMGNRTAKTRVIWAYGPTGTGKSHFAFTLGGPDVYYKMGGNKWWDGYFGQDVVIIDDYRRDLCPFHELLRLFDRYPHRVEAKGTSMSFITKLVIVTSNKSPEETFVGDNGAVREDLGQLIRRLEWIIHFIDPFVGDDVLGTDRAGGLWSAESFSRTFGQFGELYGQSDMVVPGLPDFAVQRGLR